MFSVKRGMHGCDTRAYLHYTVYCVTTLRIKISTTTLHWPIFSSLHQIFEATGKKSEIVLTVVESGYLLVVQGQKSLVRRLCGCVDCFKSSVVVFFT